jgi:hypothetical protein
VRELLQQGQELLNRMQTDYGNWFSRRTGFIRCLEVGMKKRRRAYQVLLMFDLVIGPKHLAFVIVGFAVVIVLLVIVLIKPK